MVSNPLLRELHGVYAGYNYTYFLIFIIGRLSVKWLFWCSAAAPLAAGNFKNDSHLVLI